jgi:hypothetical protein
MPGLLLIDCQTVLLLIVYNIVCVACISRQNQPRTVFFVVVITCGVPRFSRSCLAYSQEILLFC